ncbi:hypothetical protein TrVE_jg7682 [Triparma verrucosa]|uniref:Uncharacterized protein n=1 Tax=Triparma verrucosa TaxID=1606542 RepID=A0A9W7F7L6_9STRA|nr:hypothetical protein TrVE_jg7682 [Triparma verrucosa]
MSKRAANHNDHCDGSLERTRGVEEKGDGAENGSEPPHPPSSEAVSSQSSRQLMALLFERLDQKNVDYVENVNIVLIGLLHKEDERETKEENSESARCYLLQTP